MWLLITTKGTHYWWANYSCADGKNFMLAMGFEQVLRVDGTSGKWDEETSPEHPDGDREWEEHKLLHCKAIRPDFHNFTQANRGHHNFKITVNQVARKIRFVVGINLPEAHALPPLEELWKQVPKYQRVGETRRITGDLPPLNCGVRLRSRANNRAEEALWLRETTVPFDVISLPWPFQGPPLLIAAIELTDVPVGWGILEVWSEDDQGTILTKKTMQVFVYPQIRCKRALVPAPGPHLGYRTRWVLLPPREEAPPVTPLPEGPQPEVGPIVHPTPPDEEGVTRLDESLWKQDDRYFKGDRYDPAGITGYHYQKFYFSVDEQELGRIEDSDKIWRKVYCGPGNENIIDPSNPGICSGALPQYESERIDVIVLEPVEVRALTEEVLPIQKLK